MSSLAEHGLIPPGTPPRDPGGPRNFANLLDEVLRARPEEVLLVGRSGRLTAVDVESASNRFANALLSMGVEPGVRVAVSLPNDVAVVLTFIGALKAGAIWVGINRALAVPEVEYLLADSGAKVLVGEDSQIAQVTARKAEVPELLTVVAETQLPSLLDSASPERCPVDPDPLLPAAIAYTSGTTGRPKGAVHSQHNILLPGKVASLRGAAGDIARGEVVGAPLPLTILNMQILGPVSSLLRGQRLVAIDRTDAVGLGQWIAEEEIETFHAVPTMIHDLLTSDDVGAEMLQSVTNIRAGGAALPDSIRDTYLERFGERVGAGYGLTENPTSVTGEDVSEPAVPGSSGRPLPQMNIHILDGNDRELEAGEVGEICVGPASSGPFADVYRPMLGYWNQPAASARALRGGLLHTGDLGSLDADGRLFVRDRRQDLIVRGGANIYPAEIERVLHLDPRVGACAVVGVPDERLGERVVAHVETVGGAQIDPQELRALCAANLARYKVPDAIEYVASFERTPMGKIRKTALRADT